MSGLFNLGQLARFLGPQDCGGDGKEVRFTGPWKSCAGSWQREKGRSAPLDCGSPPEGWMNSSMGRMSLGGLVQRTLLHLEGGKVGEKSGILITDAVNFAHRDQNFPARE
jgi:hypothetical protein